MYKLTIEDVTKLAAVCAERLAELFPTNSPPLHLIGIPRGGLVAALAIANALPRSSGLRGYVHSTADPPGPEHTPLVVVDDILVTGKTLTRAVTQTGAKTAAVLVSKISGGPSVLPTGFAVTCGLQFPAGDTPWVQFPWEVNDPDQGQPEDAVRRLIEHAGDDPTRPGLIETPKRVLAFLDELREGGATEVDAKTFESQSDDLLVVTGIPLASLCEHHMLPYYGTAAVGYIPAGRLLGLSKIARIVQQVASGLTVQEDLTRCIAERVIEASDSPNVAVVTQASHSCMIARGVRAVGSETLASAMLGQFREDQSLRAEALTLLTRR